MVNYNTITDDMLTADEYVDLGLTSGTLWASKNVGATSLNDYGDLFAWGELVGEMGYGDAEGKTSFLSTWEGYTHYHWDSNSANRKMNKYSYTDNKVILENVDDVVYNRTNGDAHMPSTEQMEELITETRSSWVNLNGVMGRLFVGKNENSIFIPAKGRISGEVYRYKDSGCFLWSTERNVSNHGLARILDCYCGGEGLFWDARYIGYSVRGVKDAPTTTE